MKTRALLMRPELVLKSVDALKLETRRVITPQPFGGLVGACPYGEPGDRLWLRESVWSFGCWLEGIEANPGKKRSWWGSGNFAYLTDYPEAPIYKPLAFYNAKPMLWRKLPAIYTPRTDQGSPSRSNAYALSVFTRSRSRACASSSDTRSISLPAERRSSKSSLSFGTRSMLSGAFRMRSIRSCGHYIQTAEAQHLTPSPPFITLSPCGFRAYARKPQPGNHRKGAEL